MQHFKLKNYSLNLQSEYFVTRKSGLRQCYGRDRLKLDDQVDGVQNCRIKIFGLNMVDGVQNLPEVLLQLQIR